MKRAIALSSLCILFASGSARADGDASSKATAEVLFKEARQLMTSGKYDAACPKLEESQRLDPAAGTLLNLAECFDKIGRTASAWVTFGEAARAAELRKRNDWKTSAETRMHEIEPLLSYVVVEVDPDTAKAPELVVARDGVEMRRATWSTAVPVDPGAHTLTANAKDREAFETKFSVKPQKDRITVRIPRLASRTIAFVPQEHASPPPEPESSGSTRQTAGIVVGAVGLAAVATGLVFGLVASSQASTANDRCPNSPCSDRTGLDANDKAHTFATISTVGVIAGGVLTAAGLALWLWPSSSSSNTASLRFTGNGVLLDGRF